MITSSRNNNNDNTVTVRITWTPPSLRNGSFNYILNYSADQTPPYPQARRWSTSPVPVMIDGSQREYVVQRGLPYADYQVTVYAFNIKLGVHGPSEMMRYRSTAIGELIPCIHRARLHIAQHHLSLLFSQWLQSLLQ